MRSGRGDVNGPCVRGQRHSSESTTDQVGEQGFLAPVGSSEAIAGAIVQLLKDPPLRERMGQRGRQTILENYSIGMVADRYESLIRDALASRE